MSQEEQAHLRHRLNDCEARLDRGEEQFGLILQCLKDSTTAIRRLETSTKDVVNAYSDVQAAARVGMALQKWAIALIKFGGVLAVLGWSLNRLLEYWKHNPFP